MIEYIEGKIIKIYNDALTVLTPSGIGFHVQVPSSVLREAGTIGHDIYLNTYMQVREDGMFLYGFLDDNELDMFKRLITVNGVGPKAAISILSILTPSDIVFAILSGDTKTLSMAQGVGKKVAEKIVLFLKDSVAELSDTYSGNFDGDNKKESTPEAEDLRLEAANALNSLGYSLTEAMKVIKNIEITEETTLEDIIKLALKKI